MRIKTRKTSKKTFILIGVAVGIILLLGGTIAYLYKTHSSLFGWQPFPEHTTSGINYDKPTEDQTKAGDAAKQNTATQDTSKPTTGSGSDQPPTPTPQPSGKSTVNVIITAANQNGSLLQIRSLISTVTNSGTCTLTLTKQGHTVTKTAAVQAQSTTSTCQGFDIPTSEVAAGTWQASLHFENSTLVGDASQAVTVQ